MFFLSLILGLSAGLSWAGQGDAGAVSVLTFNAAGIPFIDLTRAARMAAIADRLGRGAYDLALFQEVWLDRDANTLAKGGGFPFSARRSKGPIGNGLLILSRFPVSSWAYRPYSVKFPGSKDDWIGRGALAARLQTPFGDWDVYDTHLSHVPSAAVARMVQLFELSRFIEEFSSGRPFLLAGDFNFPPHSAEAEVLRGLLGLEDVCLAERADSCGATSRGTSRRVDYLLVADADESRQTRSSFAETFPHHGAEMNYSDHLAVESRLSANLIGKVRRPMPEQRRLALRTVEGAIIEEINRLDPRMAGWRRQSLEKVLASLRARLAKVPK